MVKSIIQFYWFKNFFYFCCCLSKEKYHIFFFLTIVWLDKNGQRRKQQLVKHSATDHEIKGLNTGSKRKGSRTREGYRKGKALNCWPLGIVHLLEVSTTLVNKVSAILEISPIIWQWQNFCRYCPEAIRYNSKQENFIRHGTKLWNAKSTSQVNETERKQGIWLKKYHGIL
jgi:hypothetical protein